MKIMILAICLLFTGCFRKAINISGTYSSGWSNEFAEVRDTLQIRAIRQDEYKIIRRTCIMKKKRPEYKLVYWTATYNAEAQTLVIQASGRILYFKENEMRMGTTIYTKL